MGTCSHGSMLWGAHIAGHNGTLLISSIGGIGTNI